jgi:hypothetical protein
MPSRDHTRARQLGVQRQRFAIQMDQIGDEQEESTHPRGELPRAESKSRTSATASLSLVGPTDIGRSSSSQRGNGAKPSLAQISRTAVALSCVPCSLLALPLADALSDDPVAGVIEAGK